MNRMNTLTLSVVMALGMFGLGAVAVRAADMDHANMGDKVMADAAKPMIAVGGHCPICLTHGKTMSGDDNFVTEYNGKLYKFCSLEMQRTFVDNPEPIAKDAESKAK